MSAFYSKIQIDRAAEAGFRRRALKAFPNEYMESLWGVIKDDTLFVYAFMPIKHRGKPEILYYKDEDLDDHEDEAREEKMEYLGTIHTHPNRIEGIYSEEDLRSSQDGVDTVMGICAIAQEVKDGKTRRVCLIQYWPTPRPLKVVYGVKKRKKK